MALENKKVSVSIHIPDDIAFSILSKLPLRSVKRFTSVCKPWSLLLEDLHFMNKLRSDFISKLHSIHDDTCLLLYQKTLGQSFSKKLYMVSGEKFEDRIKIDWPPHFQNDEYIDVTILGSSSVNGLLCLYNENTIVLWNPTTKEVKDIPPSIKPYDNIEFHSDPGGFGYDHVRDDYKVIRMAAYPESFEECWVYVPEKCSTFWERAMPKKHKSFWNYSIVSNYDPFWEIYSLKSNSWKKLDGVDMRFRRSVGFEVNSNEMCHWRGDQEDVVSFDFTNERFLSTPLPPDILSEKTQSSDMIYTFVRKHLVMFNESVGYVANHDMTAYFHIWILGELGVKKSWTKLFVIGPIIHDQFPMRVGNKGNIFFNKWNTELAWLDLSTQKSREIDDKGILYSTDIVIYKKSLHPIGGMNN